MSMRYRPALLLATAVLAASGCYRINYVNLQAPPGAPAAATVPHSPPSGVQHFFVYATLPNERAYKADGVCGPGNEVREIRTRRTFLPGLISALASYYVELYAPYDLQIVCLPVSTAPAPEPAPM
jgi:hypothetical protein